MLEQLEVREATGSNDGYQVEQYLAATGLGKGYAWCSAFVYYIWYSCKGIHFKGTGFAWSPRWFTQAATIWQLGKPIIRVPDTGDVFGIWFSSKKRIAHVGLIWKWTSGSSIITVEGNTDGEGSREGDGVYVKYRLKSQIHSVADPELL